MHKTSPLIVIAMLMVAVATVFVMFAPEPEQVRVGSLDEMLFVSGYSRVALPFTITINPGHVNSVLRGSMYEVDPNGISLDRPATIRMMFTGLGDEKDLVPYRFNDQLQMWEIVGPIKNQTENHVEIETSQLGLFSLGVSPKVEMLDFALTYDQLRSMAPVNATGYEIAVGYRLVEGDPVIRLAGVGETGGCGGAVGQGNREERSELQVDPNFYFFARWFVSDEYSCPQDRPFSASVNML